MAVSTCSRAQTGVEPTFTERYGSLGSDGFVVPTVLLTCGSVTVCELLVGMLTLTVSFSAETVAGAVKIGCASRDAVGPSLGGGRSESNASL